MGWAETVFRLGRLLGWLFAKLGASFISLSANALLGLCCKEAIYFGEKNTISNQLLQKIEINKINYDFENLHLVEYCCPYC